MIDEAVGGRAWIVGHSWGGHLALHVLVACPERIAGAIIIDPLGATCEVMEEFGERLEAPLTDAQRAWVGEIEAKEEAGTATAEESLETLRLVWPSYFADPPTAPPMPDIELAVPAFAATMASVKEHAEAGDARPALCPPCRPRSPCSSSTAPRARCRCGRRRRRRSSSRTPTS